MERTLQGGGGVDWRQGVMVEEATYHPNLEPLLEHGYHKVFVQVPTS